MVQLCFLCHDKLNLRREHREYNTMQQKAKSSLWVHFFLTISWVRTYKISSSGCFGRVKMWSIDHFWRFQPAAWTTLQPLWYGCTGALHIRVESSNFACTIILTRKSLSRPQRRWGGSAKASFAVVARNDGMRPIHRIVILSPPNTVASLNQVGNHFWTVSAKKMAKIRAILIYFINILSTIRKITRIVSFVFSGGRRGDLDSSNFLQQCQPIDLTW